MGEPVVVCVGNEIRGDDAVGPAVADRLRTSGVAARVVESNGEPAGLIAALDGADRAVIVDAVVSGAAPGSIVQIEAGSGDVSAALFRRSTHLFGVAEAVSLAKVLGRLPSQAIVIGIEGAQWRHGMPMSPAVADAVPLVVETVRRAIDA